MFETEKKKNWESGDFKTVSEDEPSDVQRIVPSTNHQNHLGNKWE